MCGIQLPPCCLHPELSWHIVNSLIDQAFDAVSCQGREDKPCALQPGPVDWVPGGVSFKHTVIFMTVASLSAPAQNLLIQALPQAVLQHWLPMLEPVELALGQVLYESGGRLSHAYFPTTSIVSLLYVTEQGASAEIAVVGYDGVVGIALFMGGQTTPSRAVVQSAGHGYRLKAGVLLNTFESNVQVQHLFLRYTQALITQMSQTAVCNRHHTVDQQLCRWLLLSLDRLPGAELQMTQELIANMLGVRREGVTQAALRLQSAGLIRYARGRITVLDRPGLERRTCECYAVVKKEYDRLLDDHFDDIAAHAHLTRPVFGLR